MAKIKVAVDATMLAAGGGLSGLINYLREWVNDTTLDVTVYVSRKDVLEQLQCDCPGLQLESWGTGLHPTLRHLARTVLLSRILDRSGANVIFTTNSLTGMTRCPQVVHHRNLLWFVSATEGDRDAANISTWRRAGWRRAAKQSLNYARINVFVSEHLAAIADTVVPSLGNRIVVPNGLSKSALLTAERLRIELAFDGLTEYQTSQTVTSRPPTMLAVTSDNMHKNNPTLLRVLRRLIDRERDVNWRLEIAGRGEFSALRNLAEELEVADRVSWLGFLNEEMLAARYSNVCCMLFPSYFESFGNPPLESMARGCPVVASWIPAISEVCGDAARLHDPNDVESFSESIAEIRSDAICRADLVAAGLERVRLFDWSRSAKLLSNALREAAAKS